MHKVGGLLVNTVDSLVISAFIGVALLGSYSNYIIVVNGMAAILTLFFSPLTSIIGHLCVKKDVSEEKRYFNFFFTFNFIVGLIFYLGYYAVIDDVVTICFGEGLELDRSVSFVITLNYFIQYLRQSVLLFRDATGTFYYDRYKPLIEGLFNLVLSIALVNVIGVTGVIVATIITNIFICHIVEPYVLYKHVFNESPKGYYLKNYTHILIFTFMMTLMTLCGQNIGNIYINFLVNGIIAVGLAIIPCVIVLIINKEFRVKCCNLFKNIISKRKIKQG